MPEEFKLDEIDDEFILISMVSPSNRDVDATTSLRLTLTLTLLAVPG
jgi:hypothetical protein